MPLPGPNAPAPAQAAAAPSKLDIADHQSRIEKLMAENLSQTADRTPQLDVALGGLTTARDFLHAHAQVLAARTKPPV